MPFLLIKAKEVGIHIGCSKRRNHAIIHTFDSTKYIDQLVKFPHRKVKNSSTLETINNQKIETPMEALKTRQVPNPKSLYSANVLRKYHTNTDASKRLHLYMYLLFGQWIELHIQPVKLKEPG